jgi:hypothetical protein
LVGRAARRAHCDTASTLSQFYLSGFCRRYREPRAGVFQLIN